VASVSDGLVASGYDAVYGGVSNSPIFGRMWRDLACGEDYPLEFANISFLTLAELHELSRRLAIPAGGVLVDLACGAGGPGLWVASKARSRLAGVDLSVVGVAQARRRAQELRFERSAAFIAGAFSAVGLATGRADGVMSVDALQYAPDKRAALDEAARLLRPGGRLAFTAFEVHPERVADLPVLGDDPVADYEPLLETAGFAMDSCTETAGWRERLTTTYRAVLDAADTLSGEMGAQALLALGLEMSMTLEHDPYRRRVMVVAHTR